MNYLRLTLSRSSARAGLWILCLGLVSAWTSQSALADPVTDYNVAVEFYKQQRWDLAADSCEDFLKRNPKDERAGTVRLYWAQSLLHLRKFAEARDQFRLFVQQNSEHADRPLAMYRAGECSYFLNDYPAAETELTRFLNDFPQHDLAEWGLIYLGESQLKLKKFDAAAQSFQTAVTRFPQGKLTDDADFGLATALEGLNQKDKAIEAYQRIAKRSDSPRAADALFNIAARLFDEQKYDQSVSEFRSLVERFPQHRLAPVARLNAGYALYYLSKFEEADKEFQLASQSPATRETALYWLGISQKSGGDYAAATKTFSNSFEESPQQPLAEKLLFHWGDSEFRLRNFSKGIELFDKVWTDWPNGELADDAMHSACEAALQAGDLAKALELNQLFFKTYPTSGLSQVQELLAARIYIAQGDLAGVKTEAGKTAFAQATRMLRHVIDYSNVESTRNNARFQLARIAEREGRDADLIAELKPLVAGTAASATPEFLDAMLLSANANLRLKDAAGALNDYQRFLKSATKEEEKFAGYSGLVNALVTLQSWDQLDKTLDELSQFDTRNVRFSMIALAAGDAAFDQKFWKQAAECYRKIIARGKENSYLVPALSGLGHSLYEAKDFSGAADTFGQLAEASPEDTVLASHASYMQALATQQAGDAVKSLELFQKAEQKFTQADKPLPLSDIDAETGRNAFLSAKAGARIARELNKLPDSETLYEAAYKELKQQPEPGQKDLDLLINEWADLSYNAKNFQRSDELYELLVKERPESPLADDARLILAESLRFGGKTEQALTAFQELASRPQSDDFVKQRALTHLLDLYAESESWDKVVEVGKQIEAQFPGSEQSVYAFFRQGEGLLQARKFEEASGAFQRARDILSKDISKAPSWWPEVWILHAESQFSLKDYAKMTETITDLRAKASESPLLYRADALIGRALENQARFAEARVAYSKVIDSENGRGTETAAEAQFRIAESYLKENNLQVALREYYKVYAGYDAPKYESAALFQAGACDVTMKHFPEAAETFRKLIVEFPDSEFTEKAQARLKELEPLLGK